MMHREILWKHRKTSYGYNKAGRLAEVCASNGIRVQYRYDRNDMQPETYRMITGMMRLVKGLQDRKTSRIV